MRAPSRGTVPILPVVALLIAIISVQSGASLAKMLFPIAGPTGTVSLRIGFGTIMLCGVGRPWRVRGRFRRNSWVPLAIYGVSLGTMNFCLYQALDRLPLGVVVAVAFSGPLIVAVLSSKRPIDVLWVVIAACGIALLVPVSHGASHTNLPGLLFALGTGTCWGLYIVFGQRAGSHLGLQCVALGNLIAAVLIVPLGILAAPPSFFSRAVLLPGVAVALFSTALPYSLEMFALTRLPTRTFSVLTSLEPAVGALLGFIVLGERLVPSQWSAIILVIIASIGAAVGASDQRSVALVD